MDRAQVLAAFAALSNETRLDLVRMLVTVGIQGLPAGDIARRMGLSASRLSFHLSALEQAGLVRARRAGRQVIYGVASGAIDGMVGYLLRDCCAACAQPAHGAATAWDAGAAADHELAGG
jgi:DNA-binding transcriptional ArsR family regulator